MADPQHDDDQDEPFEMDTTSLLYVLGGVPFMIVFFVGLFLLVGALDASNTMLHF